MAKILPRNTTISLFSNLFNEVYLCVYLCCLFIISCSFLPFPVAVREVPRNLHFPEGCQRLFRESYEQNHGRKKGIWRGTFQLLNWTPMVVLLWRFFKISMGFPWDFNTEKSRQPILLCSSPMENSSKFWKTFKQARPVFKSCFHKHVLALAMCFRWCNVTWMLCWRE